MFSPDDTGYNTSIGPIDRSARAASRREIINEKRHRNTDMLPKINGEIPNGKTTSKQIAQLRVQANSGTIGARNRRYSQDESKGHRAI
jgi:hypothetical protein